MIKGRWWAGAVAVFLAYFGVFAGIGATALAQTIEEIIAGVRPDKIPADWIGSPTSSAPGYRWDDLSGGNSVRFFRGDPNDADPSKRAPFVVVVKDGKVLNREGVPIPDAVAEE